MANPVLDTLNMFFEENGFDKKRTTLYLDPTSPELQELQIDYYPGRNSAKPYDSFAKMGLRGRNVLVIKTISIEDGPTAKKSRAAAEDTRTSRNWTEKAIVALLSGSNPLDAVVIESILDPRWKQRLVDGKDGRRRFLTADISDADDVYVTREQVERDFLGGRRKHKKTRRVKKRSARRKLKI